MTFGPIASFSVVALAAALFAGCGSDDGGSSASGDPDAFCAEFVDPQNSGVDLDEDFDAGIAEMERMRDLAPSAVRDDVDVLLEAFREVGALESESSGDDDDFAAVMEIFFSPAVLEATENLETFGVDECGIDPDELDDSGAIEDSGADGEESSADESPVGPVVSEAAEGVPDPLFDPFFDEEVDLGVASYDGAQYYLDVNYTDAPWRTRLGSWTFFGSEPPTLEVGGLDLTEAEAAEVCSAVSEYLAQFSSEGTVTVSAYDQNDDGTFGEGTELLAAVGGDGC